MRAAVLGHPIAHSLSPALHTAAYRALGLDDWEYGRHDVDEHELETFLAGIDRGWAGLSLTMPLKHRALELVDHVEPLAAAVGAVNTVLVSPAGPAGDASGAVTLTGTNTDVYGLVQALREGLAALPAAAADGGPEVTRAVVLGGGATAASALAALAELGCTSARVLVRSLDRVGELRAAIARMGVTPGLVEADLTGADGQVARELAAADVVVSTLPPRAADRLAAAVGHLAPHGAPHGTLPGASEPPGTPREAAYGVLLDVAYDPRPTALHTAWAAAGGVAVSGERMLLHQAVEQVRLMTGRTGSPADALADALAAMDAALAAALDV